MPKAIPREIDHLDPPHQCVECPEAAEIRIVIRIPPTYTLYFCHDCATGMADVIKELL